MSTEQQRRWCLFTSAGDKNAIRLWLKGDTPRRWDLVVAYYGNDDHEFSEISKSSSYAFRTKGAKFQNLKKLVVQNPQFFDQYSYVWVCDDDIRMSAAQIDEAFAITEFFEFWVAQPALQGKIAHPITSYAGPQCDYRIVNFVEVGVGIFRRDKLTEFLTVYDGSLVGWGIDYWYMNFFKANEFGRFAIIDKVQVINPHDEEKGGREIDRLQPSSLRQAAWIEAMAKHGIVELPMRAFAYCRTASDRNAGADVTPPTHESIFSSASAAVLTQARTLAERLGYDPHQRLLIVHADDLAVTHAVNEAFINNIETGLINSGSVMVPGPWFPEVVAFARAHPEADIGLHLTLTSERTAYRWGPTAPRTEVPSLVDQQGYFHQTWTSETRVNSREVEVELRAQIEKAYAAGLRPTHLDSHHYRLQMSGRDLFELYLRLGREYDLPVFVARDWFTQFPYLQLSLTPRDVVIDHTVTIGPEIVPEQWPAYYRRAVESLQPGVTEFVIHPGLDNAELQAFSADRPTWGAAWRQRDLDFFTSEEFRALLAKYDIRLITWREIGARLPEIERCPADGWKGEYEEETLESKTRRLSAELEARTGEHEMLLARIAEHRGDNERLKAELANRTEEIEQHRSKIQLVLGSTSWKLTEPLRFAGRRLPWLRRFTQKRGAGRSVLKVLASPYLENSESNPGQLLLYRSMENLGVQVTNFTVHRLLFESWDIWHLHWPEHVLYAPKTSSILLRLFKFLAKLKLARAKNTKIFWTVHNLRPHERDRPLLERFFWWIFLPSVDGMICMSHSSRRLLYDQHPRAKNHPIFIIPRGHYRGAYPDSMSREEARCTLGVKSDEFVATFLGQIRAYKGVPQLIRCFNASGLTSSRLMIAGRPISGSIGQELKELASGNSRIELFLDFVDSADIQKFLRAADLVVLPYTDILNSGSAILALSFDRPVLLPARGAMADLREAVGPEWVHLYEGELTPDIIRDAAQWAVGRRNCGPRSAPLGALNWDITAKLTVEAFSQSQQ